MSVSRDPATGRSAHTPRAARRDLRVAWMSVALLPVSFVAAMVLGEWLLTVQGYESGTEAAPPLGVALRAGLPALLVMVAPAVPAVLLGLRARTLGAANGFVPALVGGVVAVASVVLNLGGLVVGRLLS